MIKQIVMSSAAMMTVLVFTGCQMCTEPIIGDPSCLEPSHTSGTVINPDAVAYYKPAFIANTDVFRPVFKAGTTRVTAIGSGLSLEDATADATAKILLTNKCDYIVAVTRIITKKTHPAGFFRFATTNYTVTLSGLPIFLEKLEKVEPSNCPDSNLVKRIAELERTVVFLQKQIDKLRIISPTGPTSPFALLNLTDIQLNMSAKAATKDPLAVALPAPRPAPRPVHCPCTVPVVKKIK